MHGQFSVMYFTFFSDVLDFRVVYMMYAKVTFLIPIFRELAIGYLVTIHTFVINISLTNESIKSPKFVSRNQDRTDHLYIQHSHTHISS